MEFEGRKRIKIHLDIAPLIDVVFQLLLFFLLTSQFIKHPGMKIDLPKAKYSRLQDKMDIVVAITKNERLFLNGISVEMKELPLRLCNLLEDNPRKVVIVKADREVKLQPVVTIMDLAKKCQAEGITISTKLKVEDF